MHIISPVPLIDIEFELGSPLASSPQTVATIPVPFIRIVFL